MEFVKKYYEVDEAIAGANTDLCQVYELNKIANELARLNHNLENNKDLKEIAQAIIALRGI